MSRYRTCRQAVRLDLRLDTIGHETARLIDFIVFVPFSRLSTFPFNETVLSINEDLRRKGQVTGTSILTRDKKWLSSMLDLQTGSGSKIPLLIRSNRIRLGRTSLLLAVSLPSHLASSLPHITCPSVYPTNVMYWFP